MSKGLLPGGRQIAECQRSGTKCYADELVRDGRNPQLLVLPDWADPPQAQERPYSPSDTEGQPRYPIAPENVFDLLPVLTATQVTVPVKLAWTSSTTIGPRVERYKVMRATGGGDFVLLATYPITFGGAPRYAVGETLTHTDATAAHATTYSYRIDAITNDSRRLSSNVLQVVVP